MTTTPSYIIEETTVSTPRGPKRISFFYLCAAYGVCPTECLHADDPRCADHPHLPRLGWRRDGKYRQALRSESER